MSKRTFQPNNRRRAKTHGFRLRMRTRAGRAILARPPPQGPRRALGLSAPCCPPRAGCAARADFTARRARGRRAGPR